MILEELEITLEHYDFQIFLKPNNLFVVNNYLLVSHIYAK